jgi:hypothetical protein
MSAIRIVRSISSSRDWRRQTANSGECASSLSNRLFDPAIIVSSSPRALRTSGRSAGTTRPRTAPDADGGDFVCHPPASPACPSLGGRLSRSNVALTARRSIAPLRPGQTRERRPVLPIGPRVGAYDPTSGADHARAEGRHDDEHRIAPPRSCLRTLGTLGRQQAALIGGDRPPSSIAASTARIVTARCQLARTNTRAPATTT